MKCLDEAGLLRVQLDDASADERTHADACPTCTRALASLATDLGRIDAVVRAGVAIRRVPRPMRVRLVPVAAMAVLVLAVVLGRHAVIPRHEAADDTLAVLDDVDTAVATYDVAGLFDDQADDDDSARSTCTWGEPFLGMGCDESPATLIAWR